MKKIYLLLTLFLALSSFNSHSQNLDKGKIIDNWYVGFNGGFPMFWGDVESTLTDKLFINTGWGVILSKKLSPLFDVRGELIVGSIGGSQPKYDRYFTGDFYDYHINGTLNFHNLIYGEDPCRKFYMYGILGVGFIQYRTVLKKISNDQVIAHRAFKSGYGGTVEEWETESFLAGGVGFGYKLDSRFDLTLENQWHVINTDLLDNKVGRFRYDIISYTSFGVTYKFNFRKNPGVYVDCNKAGNTKGKIDDYTIKNYNIDNKQIDSSRYYNYRNSSSNVNNYYGRGDTLKVIVINDTNNLSALEKRLENLEKNNNANNIQPIVNKLDEVVNAIKGINNAPVNNVPNNNTSNNNTTPVVNNTTNNNTTNNTTNVVNIDNLSLQPVYFAFNKSIIRESEMSKIENVAQLMSVDKNMKIIVNGHCDHYGTEPYNDGLSKRRAKAVARMLIKKYKISKDRIKIEYDGKKNPISPANAINRRVDFIKQK